jgi:hypothetical protein
MQFPERLHKSLQRTEKRSSGARARDLGIFYGTAEQAAEKVGRD